MMVLTNSSVCNIDVYLQISLWFYQQHTTHHAFVVLSELNYMQIKRFNAFSGVDTRNFNLSSIQSSWKIVCIWHSSYEHESVFVCVCPIKYIHLFICTDRAFVRKKRVWIVSFLAVVVKLLFVRMSSNNNNIYCKTTFILIFILVSWIDFHVINKTEW